MVTKTWTLCSKGCATLYYDLLIIYYQAKILIQTNKLTKQIWILFLQKSFPIWERPVAKKVYNVTIFQSSKIRNAMDNNLIDIIHRHCEYWRDCLFSRIPRRLLWNIFCWRSRRRCSTTSFYRSKMFVRRNISVWTWCWLLQNRQRCGVCKFSLPLFWISDKVYRSLHDRMVHLCFLDL